MQQILSNNYNRKLFLTICFLLAVVLIGIRYVILPLFDSSLGASPTEVIASVLEKVFSSLVVTVFIGCFVFWLTPKVMETAILQIIEPKEIGNLLEKAAIETDVWWFRGATGRYLRSTTLPSMAQQIRKKSTTATVKIQLLNPDNKDVCEKYANYRRSIKSAKHGNEDWTLDRVQKEVYATLLKTYVIQAENPALNIEVVLHNWFSTFRVDLSYLYVVITKEDSQAAAIRSDKGSSFYRGYRDDLDLTSKQGLSLKKITLTNPITLTPEFVKELFTMVDLKVENRDDRWFKEVVAKMTKSVNPYA